MDSISSFPLLEGRDLVHFLYRGPADDMGIASDFIGERAEEPMHRVAGTDLFYYTARLEPNARFNNRFTGNLEDSLRDSLNPPRPHPSDLDRCRGRRCPAGPKRCTSGTPRERPETIELGRLESRCGPGHPLSADITGRVRD